METLQVEKQDRILWVRLNRPDVRNAINRKMNDELWRTWRDFEADPDSDVAIVTGNGKEAFCAGADLRDYIPNWLNADKSAIRKNVETGLGGITRGLHRIYKPIIAAVNGAAFAGGFELALACDIRVASTNARFGSFEIRRGFHHGDGGIVRLVASLGLSRATELLLTGREIAAEEALRIGLVAEVVPLEQLESAARAYADRMLQHSQVAVRSLKETIIEVVGRQFDDALRLEALYGYTSGDADDVRDRLERFFASKKAEQREQ